jgi:hypothetical protein
MAKHDDLPTYGCMMPPPDSRRVNDPHEERRIASRKPVRGLLSRVASALRRA